MKRLLVLLALLGALAAPGRLAAQAIPVGPGGQLSSIVNVPIVVPIVADLTARPEKLGSFALRLQWDTLVLRITGGSDGSFGNATVNNDSLPFGVLRMAGVNPAGVGGRVTLVNLQLTPVAKAPTTLQLAVTGLYAAGSFADLDSLAVVSNGFYCPARGLWGDIDGDGNANSRDALIALSNAVGLDVGAFDIGLGDVDNNGATNARDALIILSNAVGVDVSGFRILRLAGGACSSNAGVAMSITPVPLTLVKGQSVRFEAWVSDSVTHAPTAIPDASWKSSASLVLPVAQDGQAFARDTGTVVVTALRGTRDSAQTTVHVIARRTGHWVDAAAANAKNRLGTPELPFGSIEEGQQFAQDGDTLFIRVGRYTLQSGSLQLDRPIVLMGDTAADGSRPILVPDSSGGPLGGDGIDIYGPGRQELHNLQMDGVQTGVSINGADDVLLSGLRIRAFDTGVYVGSPTHNVRIEKSVIVGPDQPFDAPRMQGPVQRSPRSPAYYYGSAVYTDAPVDTLTIEDAELGGFYYGINLSTIPDSTAIRRSSLHDFSNPAVSAGYCDCAPPAGSAPARSRAARAPVARSAMGGTGGPPALVLDANRIARSGYGYLVDIQTTFRQVAFAHNVLTNPGNSVVNYNGTSYAGSHGYLSFLGDSIVAPPENQHSYWLDAYYLDSLVVDSLQVRGAEDGYTYDVAYIRITNSTLRDIRDSGVEVRFGTTPGGAIQLTNDSVFGDPRDDAQVDAFETYGQVRVDADRVTVVNAYEGIDLECGDSSTTVTNSFFQHVSYPIYWCRNSGLALDSAGLRVSHSVFRGFSWAIEAYDGVLQADSNTFDNGEQAIYFETPRPMTVAGNTISGTQSAVELYNYDWTAPVTVTDNLVTGVLHEGIYIAGSTYPDSVQTRFDVRRNTVSCDSLGAGSVAGIDLYDAHLFVLGNQVSGCYAGIRTSVGTNTARTDSIVGNTVTAPPGAQLGIGAAGNIVARIGLNTVTGASTGSQSYGLIDVPGPCSSGSWACPDNGTSVVTIDSNLVAGGVHWGIRAVDSDTLVVLGNTVQNLNTSTGAYLDYSDQRGGITVMGYLGHLAQVLGNLVRHIQGNGIVVDHGADGVVVAVDSNIVSDVDSIGMYADAGPMLVTRNYLTASRGDGIRVGATNYYDSLGVTGNNIVGNLPYGMYSSADRSTIGAVGNWWGDPAGPRGPCGNESSVVGDSASCGIDFSSPLGDWNANAPVTVPSGAPRYLAHARALPAAWLSRAVARVAGARDGGFASAGKFPAPKPRSPSRAPAGAAAQGPAASRAAVREQARAQQDALRLERMQESRARIEARDRARQAARSAHTPPPAAPRSQGVRP